MPMAKSSKAWLRRHVTDAYVRRAKEAGYRPEGRFAYWLFGRIGDHLATPRDPQAPRTRH